MKYIILITSILITSLSLQAQDQYTSGMQKALGLWSENKSTEAVALFERISQAEKENWLPAYYAANVLIVSSFQTEDASLLNEMLKQAGVHIETAHKRSPNNSEVTTLEGLLYTAYVAFDPPTYAMKYSQKIMELHTTAVTLNSKNPRAHLNLIEYEMGSARFFNQDLTTFCDRLEEVVPLFEKQGNDMPFAPNYGMERVESSKEQCGCDK